MRPGRGCDPAPGHRLKVGLLVPLSGPAGIWGPSCLASAELAADEINLAGGIQGRELELVLVDAGQEPAAVASAAADLFDLGDMDAIVGMHISAVRQALVGAVGGRLPYVYTPLYEGGEACPGVFAIGETPSEQLRPAIAWLSRVRRVRKWALIGNDYVWPRVSNALAKGYVAAAGGQVLHEAYLPLGTERFEMQLERLRDLKPDALLLSLVGQDAVSFNRAFGASPLCRQMIRLSAAIDENMLLAIGAANTSGLYASSGYFCNLQTDLNFSFKERYRSRFGLRAPVPSALGQSMYEGMGFLGAIDARLAAPKQPVLYRSARGGSYLDNTRKTAPIYLAEADGHNFSVAAALNAHPH